MVYRSFQAYASASVCPGKVFIGSDVRDMSRGFIALVHLLLVVLHMIMTAATLGAIVEAGAKVLTLVEGLEQAEFERSRLTRREVGRLLLAMAGALAGLDAAAQARLPEIDWPGWAHVAAELRQPGADTTDIAWFAARALVPATLMWLRVYRQAEPALFDFRP